MKPSRKSRSVQRKQAQAKRHSRTAVSSLTSQAAPGTNGASHHALQRPAGEWPARIKARRPHLPPKNCPAAPAYNRTLDLPPLIPLWPAEIRDISIPGTRMIISRLATALRGERRRGRQGHWAYNLNRHAALKRALQSEREFLMSLERRADAMNSFLQQKINAKKFPL